MRKILLALVALTVAFAGFAPTADAKPADKANKGKGASAEITFDACEITSTKGISNIIFVDADGNVTKYEIEEADDLEDLDSYTATVTGEFVMIYVKAGANHNDDPDAPKGAGEGFDAADSSCGGAIGVELGYDAVAVLEVEDDDTDEEDDEG